MEIGLLGVSHASAPPELLRRVAVAHADVGGVRDAFLALASVSECVVLSTCNRVEVYVVGESADAALDGALNEARRIFGLNGEEAGCLYHKLGRQAARHLLRVACGLESMAVGEAEVLGQVKGAYLDAAAAGAVGPVLHVLFQRAIFSARKVRVRSGLVGASPSLAAMAVREARKRLGGLHDRDVLVVGAGEIGFEMAKRMAACGARVVVMSRTLSRAKAVAEFIGCGAASLDELSGLLVRVDSVVSCTGAPHAVVEADLLSSVLRERVSPLLAFDLAVPPDIPEGCERLPDLELIRLEGLAQACVAERERVGCALAVAERVLEEEFPGLLPAARCAFAGNVEG